MASGAELRKLLGDLTHLAGAELAGLWRDLGDSAMQGDALFDVLPGLIDKYGLAAAAVSADWYDQRRLGVQVAAKFTAIPADIKNSGSEALIGWAKSQTSDPVVMQQLILGGTTRRILNFSRQTVMQSAIADPGSHGWRRVGVGHNCQFCNLLIGRGAVYSEATVDFASHDHCNCLAAAEFGSETKSVLLDRNGIRLTRSTRKTRTDDELKAVDNERIREWIASHPNAG